MQFLSSMVARDPTESHRVSSPLELLFDLTFVVAVAAAGAGLQDSLSTGQVHTAAIAYPVAFFAVWWPWVNFSWFASAYATEDVLYRLAVLVQMAGVLILAMGIPRVFSHQDFAVTVTGYVVMRLAMVGLWLRAAVSHPEGRRTALRYGLGIGGLQVIWVVWALAVPAGAQLWVFLPLCLTELSVPMLAERSGPTTWHHAHIAERYSLFTIIVLGEALSAGLLAVGRAFDHGLAANHLVAVGLGGLVTTFAMWWLYFDMPLEEMTAAARQRFATRVKGAFRFGYGHYLVFASAAAVGAGIAVTVARAAGDSDLGAVGTGLACTVPVACYVLAVWVLHAPFKRRGVLRDVVPPAGIILLIGSAFTSQPMLCAAGVLTLLVVVRLVERARDAGPATPEEGAADAEPALG